MLRRFFSMLLATVLAASLAVNAAADLQPPLYAQIGYESLEDLTYYTDLTAEQYQAIAEKAESFDPYAYYGESQQLYYGMDARTYMENWGMTEAEFSGEMLALWFSDASCALLRQQAIDQAVLALGGVPGQINLLLNDRCVAFPDALPEIVNGRTMVPIRVVTENMGGQAAYEKGVVTCTLGETAITFTAGGSEAAVTENGETRTVSLDAPSYLKNGRAYVPLRFLSEAAGWDVFWDKTSRTAVVMDRETIVAALDENLTILNGAVQKQYAQYDPAKPYQFTYAFDGGLTVLDSISGDETYPLSGELSVLWQGGNYEIEGALALDKLLNTLVSGGILEEEDVPQELLPYLERLEFAAILSGEGFWISAPLLTAAAAANSGAAGKAVWIGADGAGPDIGGFMALSARLMEEGTTIGGVLYDYIVFSLEANGDRIAQSGTSLYLELPATLNDAKAALDALYGDNTFIKAGGDYFWTLDPAKFFAAAGMPEMGEWPEGLDFTAGMRIRRSGAVDLDLTMALPGFSGKPVAVYTLSARSGALSGEMELLLQIRNVADFTLNLNCSGRVSSRAPAVRPPEGDIVLDGGAW